MKTVQDERMMTRAATLVAGALWLIFGIFFFIKLGSNPLQAIIAIAYGLCVFVTLRGAVQVATALFSSDNFIDSVSENSRRRF